VNIGILTLHYGFNEGAVLQARALGHLLENVLPGARAEIVDHRYPGKQAVYGEPGTKREMAIATAVDSWLPLSSKRFRASNASETFRYCRENYSAVVVGSDVVWALRYTRYLRRWFRKGVLFRQKDPFFPAFPNVYWPNSEVAKNRVAYAPSCGNLWWKDVPRAHRGEMARRLDGFVGISVRDERTREFVRGLSVDLWNRTETVPDPTIAFDLLSAYDGSTARMKLAAIGYVAEKPYALMIMKESRLAIRIARLLTSRGWRLVATGQYQGMADVDLTQAGLSPIEWAWLPRLFEVCVTERMHCAIFCILSHTTVLGLDMNSRLPATPTKLEELFFALGLSHAYMHQEATDEVRIVQWLENELGQRPNWKNLDGVLEIWRRRARSFLSKSLGVQSSGSYT